jgi:hypothetical protein
LRCFFLLLPVGIIAILGLISVDITGSQVKPLEFSRGPMSPAGAGDGVALVALDTFFFAISAAPWHPEMQFVIRAIVVYWDVWVSASDHRFLKRHLGCQIVKKDSMVNTRCFRSDDHGRHCVLLLLDLMLDCSKSIFIHPLFVEINRLRIEILN